MLSHELTTQAAGGYTSLNDKAGGEPEFLRGTANLDWNGAMLNCIGLFAALYLRRRESIKPLTCRGSAANRWLHYPPSLRPAPASIPQRC